MLTKIGLFLAFFAFAIGSVSAQSSGDIWDDGEDEEETTEETGPTLSNDIPKRKDEARIWLNGVSHDPKTEEITFHTGDTLEITVRDLAPATSVVIKAAKGGINVSKKAFYANKKGELDLEIRLGNKRMKGKAKLYYTTSDGKRRQTEVHIIIAR